MGNNGRKKRRYSLHWQFFLYVAPMAKLTMNGDPEVADELMGRLAAEHIPASCRTGDGFIDISVDDRFAAQVRRLFAREIKQN